MKQVFALNIMSIAVTDLLKRPGTFVTGTITCTSALITLYLSCN